MFVLAGGWVNAAARWFFIVYFSALAVDLVDALYHGRTPPQQRSAREQAAAQSKAKTAQTPKSKRAVDRGRKPPPARFRAAGDSGSAKRSCSASVSPRWRMRY
jgi:hypothetical protein